MAVEILVLSGARQGQRVVVEGDQFTVGDAPGCDLAFDAAADPGAAGRFATFRRTEEGWQIRPGGRGEIYLDDYQVVGPSSRIRSGTVVRMSDLGPDFEFRIVAHASAPVTTEITPARHVPAASEAVSLAMPSAADLGLTLAESLAPAAILAPAPAAVLAPAPAAVPGSGQGRGLWIAVGAAVCVAIVSLAIALGIGLSGNGDVAKVGTEAKTGGEPPGGEPSGDRPALAEAEVSEKPEPPERPISQESVQGVRSQVLLLQVKLTQGSETARLPAFTACLIREDVLLTTASAACELAALRAKKNYSATLVVADSAGRDELEVDALFIPRQYVELAQDPDRAYRYFNLGLLTLKAKAPAARVLGLASADELGKLKKLMQFTCVGFSHDASEMSPDAPLTPVETLVKIKLITPPVPESAGDPRLIHAMVAMPPNSLGSPLVTPEGRVVALYSDVAVSENEKALADLRFFTVAAPALVEAWLGDRDSPDWIPAPVVEEDASEQP